MFGNAKGVKAFNLLIALSAFGNLMAVLLGQSRVLRECGRYNRLAQPLVPQGNVLINLDRQGVLPFPRFWASTKPFGTPLGPYFVKWLLTIIMIVAPPAGDAFNFSKLFRHEAQLGGQLY